MVGAIVFRDRIYHRVAGDVPIVLPGSSPKLEAEFVSRGPGAYFITFLLLVSE